MPRLDAERIALWRRLRVASEHIDRRLDLELTELHGLPLRHFEVLAALRAAGGGLRVREVCAELGEVPSTLSRRLDRMAADGLVDRRPAPAAYDGRAVSVSITREGRAAWRDANVTYRRVLQHVFAQALTDTDIAALHRVLGKL